MDRPARARSKGITPVFVVDTETKRCLHYDEMHPLASDHHYMLDESLLGLSTDFEVRTDLIDPGIDICTPEALALWSDSFDYDLPRRNFLNGVLKDWELNGKSIYVEIPEKGYAARAHNLAQYAAVSKDVLWRRTGPYIPEANIFPSQEYELQEILSLNVWEKNARVGASCLVQESVIGNETRVRDGCTISGSIIGRGCKIGRNVTIEDSFIWAGTTIEDDAKVTKSILAGKDLKVGKGCTINPGCVLSFGVVIDDGVVIPKNTSILRVDASGSELPTDTALVGQEGKGASFVNPDFDDLDERDPARLQRSLIYSLENFNISSSSISTLATTESDDDETPQSPGLSTRERLSSFASDGSRSGNFVTDASYGLLEALRDDVGDFDSAKMEFQGLRFASDASEAAIRRAIAVAFARRTAELLAEGLVPNKAAEETLKTPKGVAKFIEEVAIAGEGEEAQAEFALALQKALVGTKTLEASRAGVLLQAMLQQLYGLEVVEEDGILGWWNDERSKEGAGMEQARDKCSALVEWLEQEDDDDDEDDEGDEDNE
jgi:translation initiation factor eIF-2B subunit epsilon